MCWEVAPVCACSVRAGTGGIDPLVTFPFQSTFPSSSLSYKSQGNNLLDFFVVVVVDFEPLCPQHGEHYRIEIFEGSNFSGPSLELTEDCSFLQGQGWDKTCINALKVYGDGA